MQTLYRAVVSRLKGARYIREYTIPLNEGDSEEAAIQAGKRIQSSLKEGYVVLIEKVQYKHIGFINPLSKSE